LNPPNAAETAGSWETTYIVDPDINPAVVYGAGSIVYTLQDCRFTGHAGTTSAKCLRFIIHPGSASLRALTLLPPSPQMTQLFFVYPKPPCARYINLKTRCNPRSAQTLHRQLLSLSWTRTGRVHRDREKRVFADMDEGEALGNCLCGCSAHPFAEEAGNTIQCRQKGCQTVWVCQKVIKWYLDTSLQLKVPPSVRLFRNGPQGMDL
jgi:hypothetical protein